MLLSDILKYLRLIFKPIYFMLHVVHSESQ